MWFKDARLKSPKGLSGSSRQTGYICWNHTTGTMEPIKLRSQITALWRHRRKMVMICSDTFSGPKGLDLEDFTKYQNLKKKNTYSAPWWDTVGPRGIIEVWNGCTRSWTLQTTLSRGCQPFLSGLMCRRVRKKLKKLLKTQKSSGLEIATSSLLSRTYFSFPEEPALCPQGGTIHFFLRFPG